MNTLEPIGPDHFVQNLGKLTPAQRTAFVLLRDVCDISISWRALKPIPISDPVSWVRQNYMTTDEALEARTKDGSAIALHSAGGTAVAIKDLGAAALDYFVETGIGVRFLCRAYAEIGTDSETRAFVAWLAKRGQRIERQGKWLRLVG